MKFTFFITLILTCLLSACSSTEAESAVTKEIVPAAYVVNGKSYTTQSSGQQKHYVAEGGASYYAKKFNGRRTASGEKHQPQELTAAHRSLPFGTQVLVTNLRNNKQVIVRINDRGPFTKGRIIDLSQSAAGKIDMIRSGVVKVKVEQLHLKK